MSLYPLDRKMTAKYTFLLYLVYQFLVWFIHLSIVPLFLSIYSTILNILHLKPSAKCSPHPCREGRPVRLGRHCFKIKVCRWNFPRLIISCSIFCQHTITQSPDLSICGNSVTSLNFFLNDLLSDFIAIGSFVPQSRSGISLGISSSRLPSWCHYSGQSLTAPIPIHTPYLDATFF